MKDSRWFQWVIPMCKLECVNMSAVYGNVNKGFM